VFGVLTQAKEGVGYHDLVALPTCGSPLIRKPDMNGSIMVTLFAAVKVGR
jgi:hypothetical protein